MQPGSQPVVLCAGIVVADAIASPVDAAPPPGLPTLVDPVQFATGGCALSTATALARLGTPTALCGCVGDDLLGDVMRREAEARDVGTAGDAFAAGLIHGLVEGLPPARGVRLGSAVGALSTRGMGAGSTLPEAEEALAL